MKTREDLFRLTRAFWPARAVLTGVEIGLFEALGRRRLGAAALARRLDVDARALEMLLDALVGLEVLSKEGSSYVLRPALHDLLGPTRDSALPMLRHHVRLWRSWDGLTERVREGARTRREGFRGDGDAVLDFTRAMQSGARRLAPAVAQEVDLGRAHLLLDLGGGPGVYAAAFARRHRALRVIVVDLPAVCEVGAQMVASEGEVRDRIAYHPADLDRDPLPEGADAAFLSHVIHSQTEDQIRALFARLKQVLEPGSRLVVRDFFTSPDRTRPPSAALFALNMLVHGPGRSYSAEETKGWLSEAGFVGVAARRSEAAPDASYVLARTPARGA